jgi:adenylate cyclase class 2
MIEAELKARVTDPHTLHQRLSELATGEPNTYRDVYYDRPDRELTGGGRELRLRTIDGHRTLLTYKETAVDAVSGSKPEHETQVTSATAIDSLLRGLGLEVMVAFEKHCTNYRFRANGRDLLATVVTVPEIDGTFIELETMTEPDGTSSALADIRAVLSHLGIADQDLTTELYTDAVMSARHPRRASRSPGRQPRLL